MVLKQVGHCLAFVHKFENDVKMYGTQTAVKRGWITDEFENDVKMYGTQTDFEYIISDDLFENDVKMYGTQTRKLIHRTLIRLRMM